ncbi:MAG: DUF4097 domain-containing protein [Gammaproteobacteria bacterium]|nr:DUF4097 domain-containing protein [Gammaproteobacteria bacterium]
MKIISINKMIILATLTTLSGLAFAGEKVNESLQADAEGVVEIHNVRGKIRVTGWDENIIEVSGELDDLAEKLTFERQDKVILIRVEMPRKNINHGDGSNLTIRIPKGNRVDFNGVSSDFLIEDVDGGMDVRIVSGDIDIINVHKQLYVSAVSGDVTIKKSSGNAKLGTVSGDIKGKFVGSNISADTVSGDLRLHLKDFDSLSAKSVNGDVWVTGQLNDSGNAKLGSVNGDITLAFERAVNARVKVKTGPGGDIDNKISDDKVEHIFPNQQKLQMTLGDGSALIKIGTVNGSVTLKGSN